MIESARLALSHRAGRERVASAPWIWSSGGGWSGSHDTSVPSCMQTLRNLFERSETLMGMSGCVSSSAASASVVHPIHFR
eukprot:1595892-Rhodomonas_salina.1